MQDYLLLLLLLRRQRRLLLLLRLLRRRHGRARLRARFSLKNWLPLPGTRGLEVSQAVAGHLLVLKHDLMHLHVQAGTCSPDLVHR
jgi:hypothetical protein